MHIIDDGDININNFGGEIEKNNQERKRNYGYSIPCFVRICSLYYSIH
jgi:hypothetical protein